MLFYKEQPRDVKIKCTTRAQYFIDICCYQYKILFSWQKKNVTQCIFQADAFSPRDYKYICINLTLQTKNSYSCVNGKCHFLSVFWQIKFTFWKSNNNFLYDFTLDSEIIIKSLFWNGNSSFGMGLQTAAIENHYFL